MRQTKPTLVAALVTSAIVGAAVLNPVAAAVSQSATTPAVAS